MGVSSLLLPHLNYFHALSAQTRISDTLPGAHYIGIIIPFRYGLDISGYQGLDIFRSIADSTGRDNVRK